jgi:Tfp pilus assembly protein PilO
MFKNLNSSTLGPKRTGQVLLGAAVLILIVGGVILFLMNSKINDMQAVVNDKESQVGSNEQVAERYQQTLADYNTTLAHTQFLEASVSAKSFVPTLLQQLQDLATTTHLAVDAVRPGAIATPVAPVKPAPDASGDAPPPTDASKKASPPPYDTMDIEVDVVGSYANTAAFLYGLTQFPKIVSVGSVQMQPDATNSVAGAPPSVRTTLHLTAFVFHDSPAQSSADGAVAAPAVTAIRSLPIFRPRPNANAVSDAAGHAASSAIGASKEAQARSEVGIQTL